MLLARERLPEARRLDLGVQLSGKSWVGPHHKRGERGEGRRGRRKGVSEE